jgi:dTDP-4-dehydrorhamnose 3,5-epimerase
MDIHLAKLISLEMHTDDRGVFTELFRQEWQTGITPIQWNMVNSNTNVLRGVHVHKKHWDYLIIAAGAARVGLLDLRIHCATYNNSVMLELSGHDLKAIVIPPGVAHGFYFLEPSTHIYSVSEYWNLDDELGCHFTDSGLDFGVEKPHLSARDTQAGSLAQLMQQLQPAQHLLAV